MAKDIELKAWKMLAELRGRFIGTVRQNGFTTWQYKKDNLESLQEFLQKIVESGKWDYYGIMNKEDKNMMEVLEYLLDDESVTVRKY